MVSLQWNIFSMVIYRLLSYVLNIEQIFLQINFASFYLKYFWCNELWCLYLCMKQLAQCLIWNWKFWLDSIYSIIKWFQLYFEAGGLQYRKKQYTNNMGQVRNKQMYEMIKTALINEDDSEIKILCENNVKISIPRFLSLSK